MSLAPGTRLGPYEIIAPLGAGGMGEVYRAHDTRLGRDVAIKVLPPHLASAPEVRARFEREARTISQLNHPHVCTLYDVGREGDTDYLVMELLEGESLAHRLEKGPLPLPDALRYGSEIAEALDVAHRSGIVHRDLKPGNVMLTNSGAKLMDFGLARATGLASEAGTLTESPTMSRALTAEGTIVGTFQYMAPEQLEGKEADTRADLWALGCVLYEMATGERAFEGTSQASLISAIMKDEPPPITELQPLTPPALERVVKRCLMKDPDDRWQSARDVMHELRWIVEAGSKQGAPAPVAAPSRPRRGPALAGLVALAVVAVAATALWMLRPRLMSPPVASPAPAPARGRADIAVLPFQNLSGEGPNAFFASGLHDELLTQLAKVASLKVISRTSVMGYANTTKPLKHIAAELGVGSIVEGTVQVAGNRLRVNVQLIDAPTDEHVWAERYDRTLDDAFAIQSDVAQRIVQAVGAALAPQERQAIAEAPTANPEAYRLYLQGEEYGRRPNSLKVNLVSAQQLYERALALDPNFAHAHAGLSIVHGTMLWYGYDPLPARAAIQRTEAETALRLAPRLPQAHAAMGLVHYFAERDYRRALDEFQIALSTAPSDATLLAYVGYAERRLGNWAAVDSTYQRLIRLDPRNSDHPMDLGGETYLITHRYADAVRAFDRAMALAPDLAAAALEKGRAYVLWKGDLDTLRSALAAVPADMDVGMGQNAASYRALLSLWERDADGLLAVRGNLRGGLAELDVLAQPDFYTAWAYELRGDKEAARGAFASALSALAKVSDAGPLEYIVHARHGAALAGLGRKTEALGEVRWLRESSICREDHMGAGPDAAEARAIILARLGESDAALDEIEQMLAGPSMISVHTLRLDPRWDPIREHPSFKALLVKYANPERTAPAETE